VLRMLASMPNMLCCLDQFRLTDKAPEGALSVLKVTGCSKGDDDFCCFARGCDGLMRQVVSQ